MLTSAANGAQLSYAYVEPFASPATLRRQQAQVRMQARFGCEQYVLGKSECLAIEPALAAASAPIVGGVWTPGECVADPQQLCAELVKSLRLLDGTVLFGERVDSLRCEGARVVAARTASSELEADAFVLAAGPHAGRLAATMGAHLPIYPIRGYSLTLRYRGARRPKVSVTHLGQKTVYAPVGGVLRVAGMAEVDGYESVVPPDRVETLLRSVAEVYPELCDVGPCSPWSGLRPATPTSLPIVEQVPGTNLFVNAGHGALGLTLAAGSAATVERLIARRALHGPAGG
jgi:D-amino-acid dehydrogenase